MFPLTHGKIEVAGFRFGNAAYLTDMNDIPERSLPLLENLDVVISTPCANHLTPAMQRWTRRSDLCAVLSLNGFFLHMSHDLPHEETNNELPPNMQLAYDGLRIPFEI